MRTSLEFGVDADKLKCEMIEQAKKGFFGFGAQDAKYKVSYDDGKPEPKPQPEAKKPEVKKEQNKAPKKPEAKKPEKVKETAVSEEKAPEPRDASEVKGLDKVISFIEMLISDMKLNASVKVVSCTTEDVCLEIVGENLGMMIGHHGEVLDSVQYLANIVNDNENGDAERIHIDIENYRAKRVDTLNKLADRMAEKVLSTGKSVTLEPMNPYERRIIHSRIQGIEGVTTRSIGADLGRKVVISPEKGAARNDKYKVARPEYSGNDGCYDRYTAPKN